MQQGIIFFLITVVAVQGNAFSAYVEIIGNFGPNLRVTLFGCNNTELATFSRILSENGYANKQMSEFFKIEYPLSSRRHLFLIYLACEHSHKQLVQANQTHLFASPFIWLALYEDKQLDDLLNSTFSKLSILVDSNFNLAETRASGDVYMRKIFRKHVQQTSYTIEDLGLWEIGKQYVTMSRKNLGITLNTCLVITHNDSMNHLTDKRDKHVDSIAKVGYVIVVLLASMYNITLQYSIRNSWGYKTNNSQWTGMMGELVRKEADIGGTSLFFTKDRIDLIDYLARVTPTRTKFVFRQPKLSYVSNVYSLPFDTKVWISTIVLVVLIMLAMFVLMKWERARKKSPILMNRIQLDSSLSDVTFVTIGAICQQGAPALPYSTPGRITTLFLFVSLMFIYVSYSANIVALLQTSSSSIKTIEDLLNSRIPVGVDDTVYNRFYFLTADEPIRKALYQKKVAPPGKPPNYMPIEEGVKRMRQGLFAFHMETGAGYKLVSETFKEDEKCGLQEIAFIQVLDPWFAVQKNSSYKEMLRIGLRRLQESGIQQRENNLIYTKKPTCTSKSTTFISVGIVDCYPVAALLAGGIAASIIVFIVEKYANYWFNNV